MDFYWHFPSTDGGDDDGINDAGLEQFQGNRERSVARECIQNSLDARANDDVPVRVEFSSFFIDVDSVPRSEQLKDIIFRAKAYSYDQPRAVKVYSDAIRFLNASKIRVLKVSDYNTTGLDGDDTKESNGGWYRLVRSNGSSAKTDDGGGSFGIGKSAPFAASAIRTVFYSTMVPDGGVAFQGKTRISSYKDDFGGIHRGIGQCGFPKNPGVASVRNIELIPELFRRSKVGTDVFIIGYWGEYGWERRIIEAVVESFYAAIDRKVLEVVINNGNDDPIIIDSVSLPDIINNLQNDDISLYYETLISEEHRVFKKDIEGIGTVEMYVLVGKGKRRVQGMRRTLMKIHDFKSLRKALNDDYTGIIIVYGKDGNRLLRELEPPAHDIWDIDRGDEKSRDAFKKIREWLVGNLKSIAAEKGGGVEEIPELGRYLPQDIDAESIGDGSSSGGEKPDPKAPETADTGTKAGTGSSDPHNGKRTGTAKIIKPGGSGSGKKIGGGKQGKGSGKRGGGSDQGKGVKYVDIDKMKVDVYENYVGAERCYKIMIIPETDDSGDLRIIGFGEDEKIPLAIKRIECVDQPNLGFVRNVIKGLEFKSGEKKEITVYLKSNRRHIVGVE